MNLSGYSEDMQSIMLIQSGDYREASILSSRCGIITFVLDQINHYNHYFLITDTLTRTMLLSNFTISLRYPTKLNNCNRVSPHLRLFSLFNVYKNLYILSK